jgi:hypothetical protein
MSILIDAFSTRRCETRAKHELICDETQRDARCDRFREGGSFSTRNHGSVRNAQDMASKTRVIERTLVFRGVCDAERWNAGDRECVERWWR